MKPGKSVVAAVCVFLALSGCGSRVQSEVEAFAAADKPAPGARIYIMAGIEPGNETLESRQWVSVAASEFAKRGYLPVENYDDADLIAAIVVGSAGSKEISGSYSVPQFGVTGYTGATTTGSFQRLGGGGTFRANTSLSPAYGITGYRAGTYTEEEFIRVGVLKVYRKSNTGKGNSEIFSARSKSSGSCGMLSAVSAPMIEALISKFPDGGTGIVNVPIRSGSTC